MIRSVRLSRIAYGCSVLAIIGVSVAFNLLQDRLGLGQYARNVRMGVGCAYILFCAARLADAGFRFGLSLLSLILVLVLLPLIGFFAYIYYVGLPAIPAERDTFILVAAGGSTIVLGGLVTLFCFVFPSAGPRPTSGGHDDDFLPWQPPASSRAQDEPEPRI